MELFKSLEMAQDPFTEWENSPEIKAVGYSYLYLNLTENVVFLIAFLVLGPVRTRQFVSALVHDFLQTVLILIAVFAVVAWGVFTLLFQ